MKLYLKSTCCIILLLLTSINIAQGQEQERMDIKTFIKYQLDSMNGVYIPHDIYDAFSQIDKLWSDSVKQEVKKMPEEEFATNAHFAIGMWIRNNWGLWGGSRLSKYFTDLGMSHPDDMSDIILKSYHRYLLGNDIKLDEQISHYKNYWEQMKKNNNPPRKKNAYNKAIKKAMQAYKKGAILFYDYPYEFTSEQEESNYEAGNCNASGEITDVDISRQLIKVKLIKSCSPHGVIIYDTHHEKTPYNEEEYDADGKIIPKNGRKIFYMKEGDELWFYYKDDYWELD